MTNHTARKKKIENILKAWDSYVNHAPVGELKYEHFIKSEKCQQLLSGEDWKEYGWVVKESVQAYWLQATKELEKKDLGDIERNNWEKVRNETMKVTTRLAALDDGNEPKEYYIPVPVTKFGDLPTPMTGVVVFFKNRKEPWVAYREVDNIWFFDNGESCKTPTHWLKKIKK